jgi:hypothetical protein
MGKKKPITGNITLTPDECDTLKRYAVSGIIANADKKRNERETGFRRKNVSIWKQRYEAVNEKYMELKQKAQPFWMHWKLHPKRFGLLSMPSSPEERKHRNTNTLPASVDRIWKFKKGTICL